MKNFTKSANIRSLYLVVAITLSSVISGLSVSTASYIAAASILISRPFHAWNTWKSYQENNRLYQEFLESGNRYITYATVLHHVASDKDLANRIQRTEIEIINAHLKQHGFHLDGFPLGKLSRLDILYTHYYSAMKNFHLSPGFLSGVHPVQHQKITKHNKENNDHCFAVAEHGSSRKVPRINSQGNCDCFSRAIDQLSTNLPRVDSSVDYSPTSFKTMEDQSRKKFISSYNAYEASEKRHSNNVAYYDFWRTICTNVGLMTGLVGIAGAPSIIAGICAKKGIISLKKACLGGVISQAVYAGVGIWYIKRSIERETARKANPDNWD